MNWQTGFLLYAACFRLAIIAAGVVSIILGYRLFRAGILGDVARESSSSLEASVGGAKFGLRNYAPGTAFGLFGVIIISVMLVGGNPNLTLKDATGLPCATPQQAVAQNAAGTSQQSNASPEPAPQLSRTSEQTDGLPQQSATVDSLRSDAELHIRGNSPRIPSTSQAAVDEGESDDRTGQVQHAIVAYQRALTQLAVPINNLAIDYLKTGRAAEALPLARLAVQYNPANADFDDTLAQVLSKSGNCVEAHQWMVLAAQRDPRYKSRLTAFDCRNSEPS